VFLNCTDALFVYAAYCVSAENNFATKKNIRGVEEGHDLTLIVIRPVVWVLLPRRRRLLLPRERPSVSCTIQRISPVDGGTPPMVGHLRRLR
jgi:hypothetical protein